MPDVFISYSHVDNERDTATDRGWIDWFFDTFNTKLRQLCGPKIQVWRDHKIDGSDLLTPVIEENVKQTRLLISVLSPSYLESEWCRTEVKIFVKATQTSGGLRVGTKSRLLKVIKTPVEPSAQVLPEIDLYDHIGYPFYRDRDDGKHLEYDPLLGQEQREEFYREVYELALDAKNLLKTMLGSEATADLVKPTGIAIFIAESGGDLAGEAERLRRELRQLGHTVVPDAPYGYGSDYIDRVHADLSRAQIAVHPIAASMGAMPETLERRIVGVQYDLAKKIDEERATYGRPPLLRLVWMPPSAKIEAIPDTSLRDALGTDAALRICTREAAMSAIAALVEKIASPKQAESEEKAHSGERLHVYLVYDREDAALAKPIADCLYREGYAVTMPLFDGDENERRDDHDENLRDCDAILVLQGKAPALWRRAKLRDMKRAFGNGRHRPFLTRGLFVCGDADIDTFDPDLVVMQQSGDFAPAQLSPFLAALGRSQGATG